jgi:hypothetical protein
LNTPDQSTFYTDTVKGYTDYPLWMTKSFYYENLIETFFNSIKARK